MRKLIGPALIAAALAVPMLVTTQARAGMEACGDIHVEAKAECEVKVAGGCEVECKPVSFHGVCSVEAYGKCEGECDLPSVECSGSCSGSCEGTCATNPEFECSAECTGSCEGDCSGQCASDADSAECQAQCKAVCQGECKASCDGSPVECQGQCEGACKGECNADANMQCQMDCQATFSGECYGRLEGGCKAACAAPEGALFCDGQYVDHNGNLDACVAALKASLNIEVKGYANLSGECSGGSCEAEGEAGCSMSVANGNTDGSAPYALGLLGALGALIVGRIRRRK